MRRQTAAVLLALGGLALIVQSQIRRKTVLDGVYSDAQAARGQASYTAVCSSCHGNALEGVSAPALTGDHFLERWREDGLDTVYDFIRGNMPPRRSGNAGAIADTKYLDILTYILKMNDYPSAAKELTAALLPTVMLVGKDGPQPVPDGSFILTRGCFSQMREGMWVLTRATEPVRTRESVVSMPAKLNASSTQMSLGNLTFRLADLEAVPDFAPDAHKGHKMQATGYLVRQPNAERISLSSIQMLDSNCGP